MLTYGTSDLQRKTAEVQRSALDKPVVLTYHEKPRLVMMSIEEYVRRPGVSLVAGPEALPESAIERIQALADAHPDTECVLGGGLAAMLEETDAGGPHP